MRIGAHFSNGSIWMLSEDGAIHRIDNIDIAKQQQEEGAMLRMQLMEGIAGLRN